MTTAEAERHAEANGNWVSERWIASGRLTQRKFGAVAGVASSG